MFLGEVSFPLCLIHVLAICSIVSWVYVKLVGVGYDSRSVTSITLILTLGTSMTIATVFLYLDKFWINLLNKLFEHQNLMPANSEAISLKNKG